MIDILEIEQGLWVLEEDGRNVLLKDCERFGITRQDRKSLLNTLSVVVGLLAERERLDPLVHQGFLKRLIRQQGAYDDDVWEVRSDGSSGRVVFVMRAPDAVIVAAVDKRRGCLSNAVNRGVKRWKKFTRENGVSRLPRRWG